MVTAQTEQPRLEPSDAHSSPEWVSDRSSASRAEPVSRICRLLYLLLAGGFFLLAIAGVILPGLATTPLLLLTSYFLVCSDRKLNERLLKSKLFGPIHVGWQVKGGVRRDVKAKAISVVVDFHLKCNGVIRRPRLGL